MSKEEKKYKKYDHSASISRQIDRINSLISTGLQDMEKQSWDQYYNSVIMSLMTLDGMLEPFKDEEFEEQFNNFNPKRMKRGQQLSFVHEAWKNYTNLLHRQGLFYVSYSQDTLGSKNKEEDKQ